MDDLERIAQENRNSWAGKALIAIVECPEGYQVHQHTKDSVMPISTHATKRLAAARVLQLMGIGPVAPQIEPEEATITVVDSA